jgi:RNA-directed DNA polymerase
MDDNLNDFAKKNNLTYTRYADDMSFSHKTGDIDMLPIYKQIVPIVTKYNFKINNKKTRILRDHQRMTVTGIVINEKKGVPKWKWKNFRAELHNLIKSGETISEEKHQKLLGYAQWLNQLNAKKAEPYLKQVGNIPYRKS